MTSHKPKVFNKLYNIVTQRNQNFMKIYKLKDIQNNIQKPPTYLTPVC